MSEVRETLLDEIDVYRRLKAWRKMGVRRDIEVARAIVNMVENERASRSTPETTD